MVERSDRPKNTVGTLIAFCLAAALALPQPPKPAHLALGALLGAILVYAGFLASDRAHRPVVARTARHRANLAVLSLLAGTALGAVLLALLVVVARVEPAARSRFAGRLGEPWWRPWALAFESSVLEEVTFRLFALSVIVWIASRFVERRAAVTFAIAVSSLLFALAHVPAWTSLRPASAALVAVVLLLNAIGGGVLGWIFWRWGLPYAILCHLAADVVIQSLGPRLLA